MFLIVLDTLLGESRKIIVVRGITLKNIFANRATLAKDKFLKRVF